MARGGRGGGGRNPANLPREQQVSRKVSWLLRHGAAQEGLVLGKGGYVSVRDALNTKALKSLNISFDELREIVATNDKQRFSIIPAAAIEKTSNNPASSSQEATEPANLEAVPPFEDPADYLIRANQGHSIKVDTEGLLTPITPETGNVPDVVIHGTDEYSFKLILRSGGLRRMGRTHIHFASGLPVGFKPFFTDAPAEEKEAQPVISGMRKSSTVLIYIDIQEAMKAGIKFFISENGVVLTEGNEQGFVPYEFFKRVEGRKKGGGVLMSDGTLPDGVVVDLEAWQKEVDDVEGGKGKRRRGGGGKKSGGKTRLNDDSRDVLTDV